MESSEERKSVDTYVSNGETFDRLSSPPRSSRKRKSTRSLSKKESDRPRSSHRSSHKSESDISGSSSKQHSTSYHSQNKSNSPERKTKKSRRSKSPPSKQNTSTTDWMWSQSGKWQVQIKEHDTGDQISQCEQSPSAFPSKRQIPKEGFRLHSNCAKLLEADDLNENVHGQKLYGEPVDSIWSASGEYLVHQISLKRSCFQAEQEVNGSVGCDLSDLITSGQVPPEGPRSLQCSTSPYQGSPCSQPTKDTHYQRSDNATVSTGYSYFNTSCSMSSASPVIECTSKEPAVKKLEEDKPNEVLSACLVSSSGKWLVQKMSVEKLSSKIKVLPNDNPSCLMSLPNSDMKLPKAVARIVSLPDKTQQLVILEHPYCITLKGKARIRCICGHISIYGYHIKSSDKTYDVYSPDTHSLVSIETCDGYNGDVLKLPYFLALTEESKNLKLELQCLESYHCPVVILFERLHKPALDFVCTLKPFQALFDGGKKLTGGEDVIELGNIGVQLHSTQSQINQLLSTNRYDDINRWIDHEVIEGSSPVIIVCGGKSVGKSTLTRYIVNTMLNRIQEVAYLECDVGQSEFTPGSCISLNRISEPLLGPPFSHQDKPLFCCFLGVLSPIHDPEAYMNCVKFIHKQYMACNMKCPLIINTMGWNKSVGLALFTDILRLVQPDLVIQIDSRHLYKNLPPVTLDFTAESTGWTSVSMSPDEVNKQHSLIITESVVDNLPKQNDQYKPVDHRTLSLLCYFNSLFTDSKHGLNSATPYEVPWQQVAVHISHASVPTNHIMYALNASVVALCKVDDSLMISTDIPKYPKFLKDTPVCPCLGFGFIRGIDPVKKVFYLLTPLSSEETSCINCLLLGALEIPQPLMLNQISDTVPYVGYSKDVIGAKAVSRRTHTRKRTHSPRW